jgi:hypothetical protein
MQAAPKTEWWYEMICLRRIDRRCNERTRECAAFCLEMKVWKRSMFVFLVERHLVGKLDSCSPDVKSELTIGFTRPPYLGLAPRVSALNE